MANEYCPIDLPSQELIQCGLYKSGGSSAVAYLEQDHGITDFTSAAQWQSAIANGKVSVFKQLSAEIPAPTPIKVDNPVGGATDQILKGWDYTMTAMDMNANSTNDQAYETLNLRKVYIAVYNDDASEVLVIQKDCNVEAGYVLPKSKNEFQHYVVNAQWQADSDELPERYSAPEGIFTVPNS